MADQRRYDTSTGENERGYRLGNGDRRGEGAEHESLGQRAFGRDTGYERDQSRRWRSDEDRSGESGHGDYGYGHGGSHSAGSGQAYGYGRTGNRWAGNDPNVSRAYGGDFGREWPQSRRGDRGRHGEERSLWNRATEEISSWFGDNRGDERHHESGQFRGRGPKNYIRSDQRIFEDVCDRLTEDPRVDASDIEVQVAAGEVTLTGTVLEREQRRAAEDCAESVSGVKHVQNNLRVQPRGRSASADQASSATELRRNADQMAQSADADPAGTRPLYGTQGSATASQTGAHAEPVGVQQSTAGSERDPLGPAR